jgi:3-phenylpropionate/trans-cinnamate dioxygenase ferredoxin component
VALTRICSIEDVPPGSARFFALERRSVVVANRAGEFFAVDGVCPHKGFELEHAQLWDCAIECPWHHYRYDIRSGENCFPRNVFMADVAVPAEPIAATG